MLLQAAYDCSFIRRFAIMRLAGLSFLFMSPSVLALVGLHTGLMRVVWPTRTRCRVYLSTKHCQQRYEKTTSLPKGLRGTVYAMCSELI